MAEQMMQEAAGKAIPAGYQQTEVGVIPHEWNVRKLKEISPSQSVGLVINPSSYYSSNGSIPMLVGSHVSENKIFWSNANKITEESNAKLPASRLNAGDLVTVRVGAPGITAVVPIELDKANCASMMIIRKSDSFDSQWLCYLMNSKHGKTCIEGVQYGTAQKQFNIVDAVEFLFPVPPKQEQTSIANVLSDSDALIDALEQLIAKKQAIKSATMQQLLTGRIRLPAFALRPDGTKKGYKPSELGDIPEDWEVCFLADIANLKNGYAFKSADYCSHGKYCIVTIACVQNGYMNISDSNKLNKLPFDIQSHQILTRGSLLISMTGNVGRVAKVECDDLLLNQRVGLVESKSIDRDFLFYLLRNPTFLADMEEKAVGGAQGNIGKDDILSYSLIKPVCNKEQTAIATILSDMDNELQALTQKLEKAHALKRGMMQQLLTGKIRLPLAAGA